MFKKIISALLFVAAAMVSADKMFDENAEPRPMAEKDKVLLALNVTTGGPYTYSQSSHHFYGTAWDGSYLDTRNACCGQSGSCRDNPDCQCEVSTGPLPQGQYTIGNMFTYHGMPYCYELFPASSNNMCGRSGFLIHGGSCSSNPSEGCIVIESESERYQIKSGASLKVVS